MHEGLKNLLRDVHGRYRRQEMLRAAAAVAAALATALLAAMVTDAVFALSLGGLLLLDALLVMLAVGSVWLLASTWRHTRYEPRRMARLAEQRLAIEDSRFINAVELAEPVASGGGDSAELRQLAVDQGEAAATDVEPAQVVDRRRSRKALAMLGGVVAVLLLTGLIAPRLYTMVLPRLANPLADHPPFTLLNFEVATHPERLYVGHEAVIEASITGPGAPMRAAVVFSDVDPPEPAPMLRTADGRFVLPMENADRTRQFYIATTAGRSAHHELEVLPSPTFERVNVEYAYPDYTQWPAETRRLDDSGVRAIEGTRVRITVESNLPLDAGRWEMDDGTMIELTPDANDLTRASGAFTLDRSGSYRLSLVAADGHQSRQALEGPIEALADAAPQVRLIDPDRRLIAPPDWTLPLRAHARDDVGITRMDLHFGREGETPATEPLEIEHQRDGRAADASQQLPLDTLGVDPGDTLTGFVRAYDNHPDGPRSAQSEAFTVRVVSDEDYREIARQRYGGQDVADELSQLAQAYERLAEQREQLIQDLEALEREIDDQGHGPTDEKQARLEQLQEQLEEHADRMEQLAEAMRRRAEQYQLYSIEQPLSDMLEQMADRMSERAERGRSAAAGLESPGGIPQATEQFRADGETADRDQQQIELTEKQLRQLIAAQAMRFEAQQMIAIARQQRELADSLNSLAESSTLSSDGLARIRRLSDEQTDLREQLSQTLKRLSDAADHAADRLPTMARSAHELVAAVHELEVMPDQQAAAEHARDGAGRDAWRRADEAAAKLESLIEQCEAVGDPAQAAQEMDNPLSLSESETAQCMSEMCTGDFGDDADEGQGDGTGQGFASAGGEAAGGEGARSVNAAPDGFSPVTPQPGGQVSDPTETAGGPFDIDADGFGLAGEGATRPSDRPGLAEVLEPDDPEHRGVAPPHAQGVPLQFRDMTQQYFRRLAEDSR